jgi:hypothetical protein
MTPASSSTQYQLERSPRSNPIVSFCSEKFFACLPAPVLTFFIAGLLYLLCFEHVDNLGAYSIPSETGLLIPSDYVNNLLGRCGQRARTSSLTAYAEVAKLNDSSDSIVPPSILLSLSKD